MEQFHLIDTNTLISILSKFTEEYTKKRRSGAPDEEIEVLEEKIIYIQQLIEFRNHNPHIPRTDFN